jgi:predicted NAD/FAD-dependent oxidoreductase
MRVAIVGAGVSGLAVAWRLRKAGLPVTIFEKASKPGGRVWTYSQDGFAWDAGATSIAPRGKAIEEILLNELSVEGLVRIEKPIYVHDALRVSSGEVSHNRSPRYTYVNGIDELTTRLAVDTNIHLNTSVDEITMTGETYVIAGQEFDHLVIALPLPIATQLLWTLDETRPTSNVSYRQCISIMLGFESAPDPLHYHAIIDPEHGHPMTWLSVESEKSPGRAPAGKSAMVMQLSPRFSKDNFDKSDEFLVATALAFTKHLYGAGFEHAEIGVVKRWKYSQPENLARFEAVNQPGSKILVASDGLLGGRIEEAFECGYRVGELLLNA